MTQPAADRASWSRVKEIFQAAIERQPEARTAFLNEACGGNGTLHEEVQSLLDAHRDAGGFAERPAIEAFVESSRASGEYQILSQLGVGGMGEVYRARDVTLGRDVAVKVLSPALSADADRLARLGREAHLLATLNHPNICAIYGIAEVNGTPGLVLELVEGQTLAERIAAAVHRSPLARSPSVRGGTGLPVTEALTIARDIARALEAAHDKGIIHRDLKPANIKITPEGAIKVLDFGLAKLRSAPTASIDVPTAAGTAVTESREGAVLGTAAYMSPEQARGEPLDRRTDIWSFGCVLYEMLSGQRAIKGATISEAIAAVLDAEPDWTALPAATPPSIQRLLRRCLERDIRRRLKDIGDARLELEDALAAPEGSTSSSATLARSPQTLFNRVWPWLVAGALGAAAAAAVVWTRPVPEDSAAPPRRVSAEFGTDASLVVFQYGQGNAVSLSPDGALLAFVAQPNQGVPRQVYVRRLDALRATPIAGTEGAINPFFSPDGQWIAYFADGQLRKVPTNGGGAVTICAVANNRGGAWSEDGQITFSPDRVNAALWQVSSSGGEPKPLTTLGEGEVTHRWPQLLRGGSAVLFTANSGPDGFENAKVLVQTLPGGPAKTLVRGAYFARYVRSGHLVYFHDGALFAAPFDIDHLEIVGPAVQALEGVTVNAPVGAAEIAIADNGTIAYLPSPERVDYMDVAIDWLDRAGQTSPLRTTPARWLNPRFSGDGRRLAFDLFDGSQHDIWIDDWTTDGMTRLTFRGNASVPVWTPDSRRITFDSTRGPPKGIANLYWQRVDGTGDVQRLTTSPRSQVPGSWHPDGDILAFVENDGDPRMSAIMLLRVEGDEASGWRPAEPRAILQGADQPMFSPDGRWLAYTTRAPGRQTPDVFVQAFPGPGGPWQVSSDGGTDPVWSATRPELLYASPDHRIVAVPYSVNGNSFRADKPRALSNTRFSPLVIGRQFDIHPDGNRFAVARDVAGASRDRTHLTLIFNAFGELRRAAPRSD